MTQTFLITIIGDKNKILVKNNIDKIKQGQIIGLKVMAFLVGV